MTTETTQFGHGTGRRAWTNRVRRASFAALACALALICFSGVARAQVTITLNTVEIGNTDSGLTSGGGGVYVPPYSATINGTSGVNIICDDYSTEIPLPYTWTANNPITLMMGDIGQLKFGNDTFTNPSAMNDPSITALAAYEAGAWLAQQIAATPNTTANEQKIADLQYALWSIFDPTAVPYSSLDANAKTDYQNAMSNDADPLSQFADVLFFTPTSLSDSAPPGSQEMLEVTPEPASLLLFGTGLVLIGFAVRRKQLGNQVA